MNQIRLSSIFLVLVLLINMGSAKAQDDIVENGSFETGDFTGWEVFNQSISGNWFVYSGDTVDGNLVLEPPVGTYAASTAQGAPSSNVLLQDLELPRVNSIQCSVIYYYRTNGTLASPPTLDPNIIGNNQQARIDILEAEAPPFNVTDGVIQNLFQTQPGDPDEVGYTTLNFDLTQYAGRTVSFRAAQVDNSGEFNFAIDDLTCEAANIARPIPTLGQWGLIAMAGLFLITAIFIMRKRKFLVS